MAGSNEQSNTRSFWLGLVSLLGAAGTGLQNYMAFFTFLAHITRFSWDLLQGLAIGLGGICSGLVNLCINIDLLNAFMERFYPVTEEGKEKKQARDAYHKQQLKPWTWNWLKYWLGIAVFIITGILFGLTALSFSSVGVLTAIAIAAGIFVSIIMIIQELETWLSAFDPPEGWVANSSLITPKSGFSITKIIGDVINWFKEKSLSQWIGFLIAVGNVLALSLLFTVGLAGILVTLGAPHLAAVISGLCIAFTIGAFTEFYFYNFFLKNFCQEIQDILETLWLWQQNQGKDQEKDETQQENQKKINELLEKFNKLKLKPLGVISILVNAIVNGALCYAGVLLLNPLLVSAGLMALPLAMPIIAAIFGGLASLLLGADFWIGNSKKILSWFTSKNVEIIEPESESGKTKIAMAKLAPASQPLLRGNTVDNSLNSEGELQPTF